MKLFLKNICNSSNRIKKTLVIFFSVAIIFLGVYLVFNNLESDNKNGFDHPGGIVTITQIEDIKDKVANDVEPYSSAYKKFIDEVSKIALKEEPSAVKDYLIPGYYGNEIECIVQSRVITWDAYYAYVAALAWRLTNDDIYALKAVEILSDWSNNATFFIDKEDKIYDDTFLVACYGGVGLIYAAELISGYKGWSKEEEKVFRDWVETVYLPIPERTKLGKTNHGYWGMLSILATYRYLDKTDEFQQEVERLKLLIDETIEDDGSMPLETKREGNGIWYTYFALSPLCEASRIIYNTTGEDIFNYVSPNGKSMKLALDYLFTYSRQPSQWPHYKGVINVPKLEPFYSSWPLNLFEEVSDIYRDERYSEWVEIYRPIFGGNLGGRGPHHMSQNFASLLKMKLE